jgi:hypothetical protein
MPIVGGEEEGAVDISEIVWTGRLVLPLVGRCIDIGNQVSAAAVECKKFYIVPIVIGGKVQDVVGNG